MVVAPVLLRLAESWFGTQHDGRHVEAITPLDRTE
jgi:hypothetical protein